MREAYFFNGESDPKMAQHISNQLAGETRKQARVQIDLIRRHYPQNKICKKHIKKLRSGFRFKKTNTFAAETRPSCFVNYSFFVKT
jgi:hypothetical protein